MAKLTIGFSIALVLLGIICFVATGSEHRTALIPALEGVLLLVGGILALNPKLRMHAMHIAVTVALLFLIADIVIMIRRKPGGLALLDMLGMAVLSGIFVVLCVQSFISARRARMQS